MRKRSIALVLLLVGANVLTYAATGYLTAKEVRRQFMDIAGASLGGDYPYQPQSESWASARIAAMRYMSEASQGLIAFHRYASMGVLGLLLAGTGALLLSAKKEPLQGK